MTRVDGSAGGMLQDWISIPGFPWFVLGCIALTCLAIFTVNIVHVWEENDAANEAAQNDPQPHECQIGDCPRPGTNTYDRHPAGLIYVCDMHATRIQRWTGPPTNRPAAEQVYDVELDGGTDLGRWEQEMRS